MSGIIVFIVVFGLMGWLFFGLKHWDKKRRANMQPAQSAHDDDSDLGARIEAHAEDVEVLGGALVRAIAKSKSRAHDRDGSDDGGDGGGDGGGGGGDGG